MTTFKTRARTLDMLGRQQIAGIPTAISELFKNAHDAYARHVEIDYYQTDGLFVLRDDGLGMTHDEFVERWLTIGTESKLHSAAMTQPVDDPEQERRTMLGEKGIGRLAIATIGSQVLVLTRAKRGGAMTDLTAAFVNWSLFECPGVDLEDIRIPTHVFPGGELPTRGDVSMMVGEFKENNDRLRPRIGDAFHARIAKELAGFLVDPRDIDSYLGNLTLAGDGCGTHFFIMPSSDLLESDIEGEPNAQKASPLRKALLGFTNTMTPDHPRAVIQAAFRYHKTEDSTEDLISGEQFFTAEEYSNADHTVHGRFDEFGQFRGSITIYGEQVTDHVIPWRGSDGNPTSCGPFSISFAAIEVDGKHSTLPPEHHLLMTKKMQQIGGLYIYRDGVRVLPYGETEYDWLDIEADRSKSAYYYYFSHRKMFGVVEIGSQANRQLNEKAGREGFRENRAYRQFKRILKNFLLQLAADFFRKEGVHGDKFEERKSELEKTELDRRRRDKLVSVKRTQLSKELGAFFERLSSDMATKEADALVQEIETKIDGACSIEDRHRAAKEVVAVERYAQSKVRNLEARYKIARPRVGLSKAMQKEWRAYGASYTDLVKGVFEPARRTIERYIEECVTAAHIDVDRRRVVSVALEELALDAKKQTRVRGHSVRQELERVSSEVRRVIGECLRSVDVEVRAVASEFARLDLASATDATLVETRSALETRILEVMDRGTDLLDSLMAQLAAINTSGETSTLDQLVAIEQKNVMLEEELDADLQLTQLGMAVEIINHEFGATVKSLRNNLRRLKAWADVNQAIRELYGNLRASFDHLDGYLTLFTPLQRRLYRKPVEIRGSEIYEFLEDLFRERFARHHIRFECTTAFGRAAVQGMPSAFYPVFVNLVDNAVYWLSEQNPVERRKIELDARDGSFLVSDSGPGVQPRDREAIFEFGFTRKAGGRGMGLHISRETLRRVDYELALFQEKVGCGATFVIRPFARKGMEASAE